MKIDRFLYYKTSICILLGLAACASPNTVEIHASEGNQYKVPLDPNTGEMMFGPNFDKSLGIGVCSETPWQFNCASAMEVPPDGLAGKTVAEWENILKELEVPRTDENGIDYLLYWLGSGLIVLAGIAGMLLKNLSDQRYEAEKRRARAEKKLAMEAAAADAEFKADHLGGTMVMTDTNRNGTFFTTTRPMSPNAIAITDANGKTTYPLAKASDPNQAEANFLKSRKENGDILIKRTAEQILDSSGGIYFIEEAIARANNAGATRVAAALEKMKHDYDIERGNAYYD